jgi:hypothetical protein
LINTEWFGRFLTIQTVKIPLVLPVEYSYTCNRPKVRH